MSRLKFPLVVLAMFCFLGIAEMASAGTTYYVAANGNDSSNGTSKTTPWAHLPGMATWTGNHTPVAGDTFVLRGCDVWGNPSFPIKWPWAGATGSPIAIGVDKTWFNSNCSTGWNRPIFDGGGAMIGSTGEFFHGQTGISNLTLDNIEARGFFWNTNNSGQLLSMFCFGNCASGTHAVTVTNFYVHGWSHTALGAGGDVCTVFQGASTSPYSADFDFEYNVVDGTDSTNGGDSCRTFEFIGGTIRFNIVVGVSNGFRPAGGGELGYNNCSVSQSFDPTIHENCFETQVPNQTFYIHDNFIHDMQAGEGLQVCMSGETDYVWNNVWSLTNGGNPPAIPSNTGSPVSCTAVTLWNNTIVPQPNVNCVHRTGASGSTIGTLTIQNNHCITTGSLNDSFSGVAATQIINSDTLMTPTTANTQGYTASESYQYSPISSCTPSTCSTLGAGTNLSGSWPSGYSANDTSYACTEQTVAGVVQSLCPARVVNGRPGSGGGNWDSGAYFYATTQLPQPPTDLATIVQ